jgi:long-subunit fatty acid transport protein
MRDLTLTLSEPTNAAAPARIRQTSHVGWRDQWVSALGLALELSQQITVYAGFNHARNPAPPETLSPLLAATGTRHATTGVACRGNDGWSASGALEYQFGNRVTYTNPNLPLGAPAQERTRYVALNLMVSRRW